MDIEEFKSKLDSREFWGSHSKEMYDAANEWAEQSNQDDNLCKWSWDVGLKLDYDGEICTISSRFYPPHKNSAEYGKYDGIITVLLGEDEIHNYKIEAETLNELKTKAEEYSAQLIEKIKTNIEAAFT